MERLFLALWPGAEVRAPLAQLGASLVLREGRLVAAANLHVTLIFLGNTTAVQRTCVEQVMSGARSAAFEFELTQLQWQRRTGTVWASAAQIPSALLQLVTALQNALSGCGYSWPVRPYRLHVTLARGVRRGPRERSIAPIRWQAAEVSLVSSRPTPAGSHYTVERRWPLG